MVRRLLLVGLLTPYIVWGAGTCNIATVPVNFGGYDVFSPAHTDSNGQITISCSGVGTVYSVNVQLNRGLVGSIPQRQMRQTNGHDRLSYNLYINAGRSIIWGDGTGGSSTQTVNIAGGSSVTLTIYGRVPALQNATLGTYSDTISVIINY